MERREQDDRAVAIDCNTEDWPDEPEAWALILSSVWALEIWVRYTEEDRW